jgi:hypothetical protein
MYVFVCIHDGPGIYESQRVSYHGAQKSRCRTYYFYFMPVFVLPKLQPNHYTPTDMHTSSREQPAHQTPCSASICGGIYGDKLSQTFGFGIPLSGASGPGSSVGIATCYGLDGPGIESRWGRDFSHMFRLALGPTQPPVRWVPGISRG